MSRRLLAIAVGLLGGAVGGGLAWALVGRALREWESGAFAATRETVIVVLAAVVLGTIVGVLAWRWLLGPPIEHAEWTLTFPPGGSATTVAGLRAPLAALGYALELAPLDDAGHRGPALRDDQPFAGRPVEVTLAGLAPRLGKLVLRVPAPRPDQQALGFLDAYGALDGAYEELAQYALATLGRLFPGVTYRRLDSSLSEEDAAALWDQLPARPLHPSG